MDNQIRQNWGATPNLAPTERRIDPLTFITSSLIIGTLVFTAVLWLLWCPLPLLGLPRGSLGEHSLLTLKLAVHAMFPRQFAIDARWYATFLSQQSFTDLFGMGLRLLVALVSASVPAFMFARIYLRPRDAMMEIRGGHRFELLDGKEQLAAAMKSIRNGIADFEFAPGVAFPSQIWSQHVLAVGGVGSGKSTFMRPLLKRIVQSGDRLLCFDPKGEFTAGFKTPVIMAPWDARSHAWDIAADMRNHGDMERFASAMIKDSQDPMWSNAARGLLVGFLVYLQSARGTDWGWQDLADMLTLPEEDILPMMQRYYPEASRAVASASVTTKGILINLDSFCRPIFHLARAWGQLPKERRISFVQWTKDAKTPKPQVMLQGNGAYPELTRAYVEGIVSVISGIVNSVEMDDDPKRKIWILADEFAQMGKIPVRPLFEVGRSRGVRCIVACQDFAQLEEVHGKEGTRALVSMCGTLMVGRVGPGETAETLSKNLGNREVERSNLSTSYDGKAGSSGPTTTLTYSRDSLALYVPAELAARLGDKPAMNGCVFAVAVQGKVYEILWPYFTLPKLRKAHVPAPWTLGLQQDMPKDMTGKPANPDPAGASCTGSRSAEQVQGRKPEQAPAATVSATAAVNTVSIATPRLAVDVVTDPTGSNSSQSTVDGHTAGVHVTEGFDPIDTVAELATSRNPTETAAHLALQALEILKSRPGPTQRVQPSQGPAIRHRG